MPAQDDARLTATRLHLKEAQGCIAAGDYGECCVQAEQTADKALKALLHCHSVESQSDTLADLLLELQSLQPVPEAIRGMAEQLDIDYASVFSPADSGQCGLPPEYFEPDIASRCLDYARKVVSFIEANLP